MPYQSFLNRKLIGPDGLYAKPEPEEVIYTALTKGVKQEIVYTALTRGVAYNLLCQAKKTYFGNKPWSYIKSYIKEIKP
jgi:hypothetical protein